MKMMYHNHQFSLARGTACRTNSTKSISEEHFPFLRASGENIIPIVVGGLIVTCPNPEPLVLSTCCGVLPRWNAGFAYKNSESWFKSWKFWHGCSLVGVNVIFFPEDIAKLIQCWRFWITRSAVDRTSRWGFMIESYLRMNDWEQPY